MPEPLHIFARMRWGRAIVDSRLERRLTLDYLFADLPGDKAHDLAYRASLERFVFERGPRLQRLASIGGDNSPSSQPDEAEFDDAPLFSHSSAHTLRQSRTSARWLWVCGLAQEGMKVWIWAGSGVIQRHWSDGYPLAWNLRVPTLMDVIGSHLLGALARWASFEAELAYNVVQAALERQREANERAERAGKRRTMSGIYAVLIAFLSILESFPSHLERKVILLTQRVYAAGGQTSLFPARI